MKHFADEIVETLTTLLDYVRFGQSQINAHALSLTHGYDNAWDESLAIVLFALHIEASETDNRILPAVLTIEERRNILALFEKRIAERIPTAYLTNTAWFAGLPFYVDERVIIPRSPFAELIEQKFSPWMEEENIAQVLDLCCGSACIGIATALQLPDVQVDVVDISEDALEVAEENIAQYEIDDRVTVIASDLFAALGEQRYDIILSNPPYVSESSLENLPQEFHYEPRLALAAGVDGLSIVDRILKEAAHYLTPHGILLVEVGESAEILIEHYPDLPFTWVELANGGDGIFMLRAADLVKHFPAESCTRI